MERIVDPPRDIPLGVRLSILCSYGAGNPVLFLPAAAMLLIAFKQPGLPMRVACFVIGSLFLWVGLREHLPVLWRSFRTLHRMRVGNVTMGRITSCRPAWDGKRADMPYREFLGDWAVNMVQSEVDKGTGCLVKVIVLVFVAPFVLIALAAGFFGLAAQFQLAGVDLSWGSVDAPYLMRWAAMALASTAVFLVFLKFARLVSRGEVVGYMEWRKLARPGRNDVYNDLAIEEVEEAKRRGVKISLKEPLPEDSESAAELECKVDYSLAGQRCTATGRARLCARLDLDGFERLVFDPLRPQRVDLFVGLPEDVAIDAQLQWAAVPIAASALRLMLAGGAALVAIAAFAVHVRGFNAMAG